MSHREATYNDANIVYMLEQIFSYWAPSRGNKYVAVPDLNSHYFPLIRIRILILDRGRLDTRPLLA